MTFKKTIFLLLFLLIPQTASADFLDNLLPFGFVAGAGISVFSLCFLYATFMLEKAKSDYPKYQAQWSGILNAYETTKNWEDIIYNHDSWSLSATPLHAMEDALTEAINTTTSNYGNLEGNVELEQLRADFLKLNHSLCNLLKAFAPLRATQNYAIEETILTRKSFENLNKTMKRIADTPPHVTYGRSY